MSKYPKHITHQQPPTKSASLRLGTLMCEGWTGPYSYVEGRQQTDFNLPVCLSISAIMPDAHSICITFHILYGLKHCYHFYGLNRWETIMSSLWISRVKWSLNMMRVKAKWKSIFKWARKRGNMLWEMCLKNCNNILFKLS